MSETEAKHYIQELYKNNASFTDNFIYLLYLHQNVTNKLFTFMDVYNLLNGVASVVKHNVTMKDIDDILLSINGSNLQTADYFYADAWLLFSHTTIEMNHFQYLAGLVSAIIVAILFVIIIVSNLYLLSSLYWLKGKEISTTLKMSLSMAVADLLLSIIYGGGLIIIYVDILINHQTVGVKFMNIFLPMALGGFIIVTFHLLAVTTNHYIGILWPLKYTSIATSRNIKILLILIWILPTLGTFVLYYFVLTDTAKAEIKDDSLRPNIGRRIFDELPIAIIAYMYIHILIVIQNRRKAWAKLEASGGGYRHCGTERQNFEKDVKVIHTTLIIFGTFLLFFGPTLISVELEPYFNRPGREWSKAVYVYDKICFILYICKPVSNPIIYTIRMPEIKEATFKMRQAVKKVFIRRIAPSV